MNPKVIAFRTTEKEQAIIDQFMKDKGIKSTTEAMKQAIQLLVHSPLKSEQTPREKSMYAIKPMKLELSYALEQELNRFLRGQLPCPTIEAIFGLNPNSKIKVILP